MCKNKVKIGYLKTTGDDVYLEKHKWDCDWYWSFGYLITRRSSFHFDQMVPNQSRDSEITFIFPWNESDILVLKKGLRGWVLMELFQEAYILKSVAELHYFGHAGITALDSSLKDEVKYKEYNQLLEKVLDKIWDHVTKKGE